MDDFREWLSDNLRYILLILGILAVIAIVFFGIRFFVNRTDKDNSQSAAEQTAQASQEETGDQAAAQTPSAQDTENAQETDQLQLNAVADVTNLVQSYYNAISNKDVGALNDLLDVFSEDDSAQIVTDEQVLFTDVNVYTKKGFNDGSYIAFARYNYKTASDNMTLPGLSQLYVITDGGKLVIKTQELSEGEKVYLDKVMNSSDVQALISEVNADYQKAMETSQQLSQAEEIASQTAVENTEEESAEEAPAQETSTEPAEETAVIKSSCNIRAGASSSSDIIGEVSANNTVVVLGKEGNWVKIKYDNVEGYISEKFL